MAFRTSADETHSQASPGGGGQQVSVDSAVNRPHCGSHARVQIFYGLLASFDKYEWEMDRKKLLLWGSHTSFNWDKGEPWSASLGCGSSASKRSCMQSPWAWHVEVLH